MSITKVQDFFGDSFDFEEPVGNRFGSESIGLVAEDGGPLLLQLKDCLAYGINKDKKFGKENLTIPLAVGNHKTSYRPWKYWREGVPKRPESPGQKL
jgi:hypothetical protein